MWSLSPIYTPILRTSTPCSLSYPCYTISVTPCSWLGRLPQANVSDRTVGCNLLRTETNRKASVGLSRMAIPYPPCYKLALIPFLAKETSVLMTNTFLMTRLSTKHFSYFLLSLLFLDIIFRYWFSFWRELIPKRKNTRLLNTWIDV